MRLVNKTQRCALLRQCGLLLLNLFVLPSFFLISTASAKSKTAATKDIDVISASEIATTKLDRYIDCIIDITINQQEKQIIPALCDTTTNHIWLDKKEFGRLGVTKIPENPIKKAGKNYYPLTKIPNASFQFDSALMKLDIQLPHHYFPKNNFILSNEELVSPQKPDSPGGFLNYDLFFQKLPNALASTKSANFEIGLFNRYGVGTANFLVQGQTIDDPNQWNIKRLNTTWTIDQPSKLKSFRLGDAIAEPGLWGSAVSFGGIQWGTNFSVQPDYIQFPLLATEGVAKIPSTVDILVNNSLIKRQTLAPGPFDISNIPLISGRGDVQVVVTDLLGQQKIITIPYYTSTRLLRKGIHDYSVSLGLLRFNFGLKSNDYKTPFASVTDTYGVTDKFSTQWHTELSKDVQDAGVATTTSLPKFLGILTLAGAASHTAFTQPIQSMGGLALLQYSFQGKKLNYQANFRLQTPYFRTLGANVDGISKRPSFEAQIGAGMPIYQGGLGISYTERKNRDEANNHIFNMSYSLSIGKHSNLSLNASFQSGAIKNQTFSATYLLSFGSTKTNKNLSLNYNRSSSSDSSDKAQWTANLNRSLPPGKGYGYRIQAATGQRTFGSAEGSIQTDYGTYRAGLARENSSTGYKLQANGGIAMMAKQFFFSRFIRESFAIIEMPGLSSTPVRLENHPIATTNQDGFAFIPNLGAYRRNHFSVDPNKLPINSVIPDTKFDLIPYFRSGVFYKLPIRKSYNALLIIHQPSGEPIPIGAEVSVEGLTEIQWASENGETFLTDLKPTNNITVSWKDQSCQFILNVKDTDEAIPHLGTFTCQPLPLKPTSSKKESNAHEKKIP
jgi:outer membrane usher protein